MCLLSYFPPGLMPDTAALLNGAVINDDGHGFATPDVERDVTEHRTPAERLGDVLDGQHCGHSLPPTWSSGGGGTASTCQPSPGSVPGINRLVSRPIREEFPAADQARPAGPAARPRRGPALGVW